MVIYRWMIWRERKKKGEGKKRNSIIISSFLYHLSIRYYVQNDIQITNNA